jgi:CRP/FNR family transcriptional regulator, cyclic AMP receptor protein
MTLRPEDLHGVALLRDLTPDQLTTLTGALEQRNLPAGHVLFRAGEPASDFLLLMRGEVTIKEGDDERVRLHPISPIGELGALAGLRRNTEAVTAVESEVWGIAVTSLMQLFEQNTGLAFHFYRTMLAGAAEKVRHDRRRIDDMRENIIRTQKRMKQLRELVLSSRETELSKPIFEALDELIERNRRAHYRVTPNPALPSSVRMEDGSTVRLLELSDGYLKLDLPASSWPRAAEWSGVVVLPGREILVSGRVVRGGPDGVVMKLDLLIDDYKQALADYVTQLQLLDFVM